MISGATASILSHDLSLGTEVPSVEREFGTSMTSQSLYFLSLYSGFLVSSAKIKLHCVEGRLARGEEVP